MTLQWIRTRDYETMCCEGASRIAEAIEKQLARHEPMRLGLATGNTMLRLYERLAELLNQRRVDLSQLHTFNLDEYVGPDGDWIPQEHVLSYHAYMDVNLFGRLDPGLGMNPEHIHFPEAAYPDAFDERIRGMGGLNLQLLGIGFNGHIAFNEPVPESEISATEYAALPSRVIELTQLTIETNARLTAHGDRATVPRRAVTMGMRSILGAEEILLLACFPEQQEPLRKMRHGRPTPELPASFLMNHPNATIIYAGDRVRLDEED